MKNRILTLLACLLQLSSLTACSDDEETPQLEDATSDAEDVSEVAEVEDSDSAQDASSEEDSSCTPVASAVVAESMDDLIEGIMATGRPGDVVLRNDRVQVTIQAPGRNIGLNPYGGNIIDADIVRDGDARDAFGELGLLVNLAGTIDALTVEIEADGSDCGEAVVVASGVYALSDYINTGTAISVGIPGGLGDVDLDTLWPISLRVEYRLAPSDQFVRLNISATNQGDTPASWALGYLLQGGLVDTFMPGNGSYSQAMFGSTDLLFFEGEDQSYALFPITEERVRDRFYVAVAGGYVLAHDASLLDVLDFFDNPTTFAPGETVEMESLFIIGEDLDAVRALVREHTGLPDCVEVPGRVLEMGSDEPLGGVDVTALGVNTSGSDSYDLTHQVTDSDGGFSFCLEPGTVRMIAGQQGRPYSGDDRKPERVEVEVPESAGDDDAYEVILRLPVTGHFRAVVTDEEGEPMPSRVAIIGVDPSPHTYRLSGDGFDPLAPGVVRQADSATGQFDFLLEPGEYDAVFTHGPEYSQSRQQITVTASAETSVEATLFHVVDTTGYMSGDFHVHAQAGPDSIIRDADRVTNMAAENVEILVSTDHANITDYRPVIDELGLGDWITTVPGQEITTSNYGHFMGFPLPFQPELPNNGAYDWGGQSPNDIGDYVLDLEPQSVFQLAHPRAMPAPGLMGDYFYILDLYFDETGPHMGPEAQSLVLSRLAPDAELLCTRFTAMEVVTWVNVQGLSDWFNFLNAGLIITATGNSDTHTVSVESSGWARNFVYLGYDTVAEFQIQDFVTALYEGRNTVSFGPFATLSATGGDGDVAGIGETLVPDSDGDGEVHLTARVQAPLWLPFDRVVLIDGATGVEIAGGDVVPETVDTGGGAGAQRLETVITHDVTPVGDTWYVVVVTGTGSLFPGIPYNESDRATLTLEQLRADDVELPATSFAVTNPIWIDADDDGEVTPSHLVLPEDYQDFRREDRINPY